jgi:hypothetical protein
MSKSRHNKADGGKIEPSVHDTSDVYAGKDSNVEKEAKMKKRGGRTKDEGLPMGKASKMRLDRPGRKRGGRTGADMSPLTTAAKRTDAKEHKATEGDSELGP